MRLEKQDGGWGYSEPTPRSQPKRPEQLPPRIQFIKNVLIAVAILAAIIGVPTLAAETIASGTPVNTIVDTVCSLFVVAFLFVTIAGALLQMGM